MQGGANAYSREGWMQELAVLCSMGCCIFQSSVLEDNSIKAYLRVKRFVVVRGHSIFENNVIAGLLYTDGQHLFYESTRCGDKRACCLCCRYSISLSAIKAVIVTQELPEVLLLHGQGCAFTAGRSYLQLTTEGGMIIVAAQEMGSFPQTINHMRTDRSMSLFQS